MGRKPKNHKEKEDSEKFLSERHAAFLQWLKFVLAKKVSTMEIEDVEGQEEWLRNNISDIHSKCTLGTVQNWYRKRAFPSPKFIHALCEVTEEEFEWLESRPQEVEKRIAELAKKEVVQKPRYRYTNEILKSKGANNARHDAFLKWLSVTLDDAGIRGHRQSELRKKFKKYKEIPLQTISQWFNSSLPGSENLEILEKITGHPFLWLEKNWQEIDERLANFQTATETETQTDVTDNGESSDYSTQESDQLDQEVDSGMKDDTITDSAANPMHLNRSQPQTTREGEGNNQNMLLSQGSDSLKITMLEMNMKGVMQMVAELRSQYESQMQVLNEENQEKQAQLDKLHQEILALKKASATSSKNK